MTTTVRATLLDPAQQAQLERDGYVVRQFLSEDELSALTEGFDRLGPAPGDPRMACHSSFQSYDASYKRAVDSVIRGVLGPPLSRVLDRQRMLPASYISKWPGDRGGFGLHQDLALVDETRYMSVVIWVALDDTTPENGQLWVVPGSHRWLDNPRGIQAFEFPYTSVARRIVERHGIPLELHRGEAAMFSNAMLHFSPPNRSDAARRVALTQVIPEEVPNIHYFGDGRGNVDVYEISDESFWTDNNPFVLWSPPPALDRVGSFRAERQQLTDEMLDELVAQGRAVESERPSPGPINTPYAWCHRCGSTDVRADAPHRWVGNVTLLCDACERLEFARAGVPRIAGGLQDPDARCAFDADGYVTLPLLGPAELELVRAVYDGAGVDPAHGVVATTNDLPPDVAGRIDAELREILRPVLRDLLPGYEIFLAGFVSKGAVVGGAHPYHQDLTFTDERHHRAVIVWVPLDEVDESNGALHVVPGSHLWTDGIRPGMRDGLPTSPFTEELHARARCLSLGAGSAVVYDPAMIHGSGPNPTDQVRVALTVALVERQTQLVHFTVGADGNLAGFAVDDAFYVQQSVYDAPVGYAPAEVWTDAVAERDLARHLGVPSADARVPDHPGRTARSFITSRLPVLDVHHGRSLLPPPAGRVLLDPDADRRLRRDGFVKVPLLDAAVVAELRGLYGRLHGWSGVGFEADLVNPDPEYRRTASAHLARVLDERVADLFVDHEPYLRNFLCKWPDGSSALNLHRDWMYIDERSGDHSYVVWMPLVDVSWIDGPLQLLRHSHRLDPMLRGTDLNAAWVEDEVHVRTRLLTVPARATEAVILDNALVHCSPPNGSGTPRPVAAVGMRPRGAPLVHYRRRDDSTAARYDVDEDFFLEYTPGQLIAAPPDLPVAEVVPIGDAHLDGARVVERLGSSLLTHLDTAQRRVATFRRRVASGAWAPSD